MLGLNRISVALKAALRGKSVRMVACLNRTSVVLKVEYGCDDLMGADIV